MQAPDEGVPVRGADLSRSGATPPTAGRGRRVLARAVDEGVLLVPTVVLGGVLANRTVQALTETATDARTGAESSAAIVQQAAAAEAVDVSQVWEAWRTLLSVTGAGDLVVSGFWSIVVAIVAVRFSYRFVTGLSGVSVGRALVGARLRRSNGGPLGVWRALLRAAAPPAVIAAGFAAPVVWLLLPVNAASLFVLRGGRTLLDRALGSSVLRRKPLLAQ
jgi:hypothetical protein